MERLTKYGKTSHENGVCCTHFMGRECLEVNGNCAMGCKWEEEAWSKLAHYEDLEEQGLLLKLPCKVGDIVWTLKFPEITKEDGSVWTVCDRKKQTVVPVKFTLFILNDIGVYYFLTKEKAEAKLKELQSK